MIKHFERNAAGRDFAVGDIHGHFTRLQKALDAVGFDPAVDRLFSVGDLIDRGPECEDVEEWLAKSWFHPVRGNHDDFVCRYDSCDPENWLANGGAWFMGLPTVQQQCLAINFLDLPYAIEVETSHGLVGIVHADVPCKDWRDLPSYFDNRNGRNYVMWSRTRIQQKDASGIAHISALIVGHTPVRWPVVLGNVYHIDTGGWFPEGHGGYFTLVNLETMETIPPMPGKLEW